MPSAALRALPSVDRLVEQARGHAEIALPHALLVEIAREVLSAAREDAAAGATPEVEALAATVAARGRAIQEPSLRPLINGSGVIVQTNLGRAPLSAGALRAIAAVAAGYSNLEYDLAAGERGSRASHLSALLARLTGAEAALAVNNNAAAVLLVLAAFCASKEVLVSRSQAVEIGGGFRIPDVLRQSGARLVEVGTTNRTYAHDYATAITSDTAAILTVHRSNFQIVGFTHEPADHELRHLAYEAGILWIDDWGSGALLQPGDFGLAAEPTVAERVHAGCDIVCFSGDKLLGGPQAGLIVGGAEQIGRLRSHPLLRALRVDKTTLAALEATLLSYLRGTAVDDLPVWQMIAASGAALETRARALAALLAERGHRVDVVPSESAVGGGSLPGETLPSWALALPGAPDRLHARLRAGTPAVVGRIAGDRLLLDVRTVLPEQEPGLADAIVAALEEGPAAR